VDVEERAALLARSELFGGASRSTRQRIAERLTQRVVEKGELVFAQDEPGDRMFVVADGAVKLFWSSGHGIVELVRHHPPAAFGEVALLDGGPRSASAEALERSLLLVVTRAELLRLLRSEEEIAEALLRSLGTMVRRTTRQMTDLVFVPLQGRVARQLLLLADTPAGQGTRTRHITQGDLATMVGGARQTVNQVLRSLQERGYIRADGRTFEILRRDELQRLADG
jgi:CRP/FNR family transcriptional regulator, cyclic AMP receptor protein